MKGRTARRKFAGAVVAVAGGEIVKAAAVG